ncbi:hypothetical protein AAS21_gp191 [Pantoea phage vB_PagS_AAS21]|uniref:Uncharacterized protein n=1 Tax=Pantoea phage vB_PagS_AAS21 TaxID=2575261 RepID=A0A4Y5P1U8_9CAUD|nr:hypothetical protein AAS21_gp191 [Pantoea phage vB_PagS_AAS21]
MFYNLMYVLVGVAASIQLTALLLQAGII